MHDPWLEEYSQLEDGSLGVLSKDASEWSGLFYEKINLSSFPSSHDFYGKKTYINKDVPFMIIGYVGRPETLPICASTLPKGALGADVIQVLACGFSCQALRCWILPL